jgi:hypothetical protein
LPATFLPITNIEEAARFSLYSMALVPFLFFSTCSFFGERAAKEPGTNLTGDPVGASFMYAVAWGIFVLIPWGFCVWDTFSRSCSSCGRLDAMRDIGRSENVGTRDTTQKEIRYAFMQHQLGKPEEMIAYSQDVKVKEHTTKTARRCIFCDESDDYYSSYTTKY